MSDGNANSSDVYSAGQPAGLSYVDVHCHCLPGLDDGPGSLPEAAGLCRELAQDGCRTVIATPHQLGRFDGLNLPWQVREAVGRLNEALAAERIPLAVVAGADVRLDERLAALLEADRILTLADGGRYLLAELPDGVFLDLGPLITELSARGVRLIISHPERHPGLWQHVEAVRSWLEQGLLFQVTAGSLAGDFGPAVERAAWYYVQAGWAAMVATDAHNLKDRRPRMSRAFSLIAARCGPAQAQRLCVENPQGILGGQEVASAFGPGNRGKPE